MSSFTLRSLLGRRRRAALTGLAVLLGVAMVCGTFVFTDTIHRSFRQLFTGAVKGAQVIVASRQGPYSVTNPPASFPEALQSRIARLPGVAAAQGQISDVATIVGRDGRIVRNTGSPTLAISYLPPPFTGLQFVAGGHPVGENEVALDQATAAREGYRVGDLVPIVTGQPVRRFQISGIARIGSASIGGTTFAVFDRNTAQTLYDKQGLLDIIYVAAANGTSAATLEHEIRPLLPPALTVQSTPQEVDTDLDQVGDRLQVLTGGLEAFGFIAVLVGAFVIFNTLSITVTQRTRELALLRALGATRRQLLGSVIFEALAVGALSSAVGLLVGLAAALAIRAVFKALGVEVPSTGLVLEPRTVIVSVGVGVLVTVAACLAPAFRATRASPIEALGEAAAPSSHSRFSLLTVAAALALAAAAVALVFAPWSSLTTELAAGTAGAVMLVLAAVLLSPLAVPHLSRLIAWPLERGGRILARLARDNATRTPARTAITASSLMIGLALVLFVSVYIDGVRTSTRQAIDRTFVADFAIGSEDGSSSIPAASARAVAGIPNLLAVSSVKTATAQLDGAGTVSAAGVDPSTIGQVYRFDWTSGSPPSVATLGPNDVLVEHDTARAAHLHVGEAVTVRTSSGLLAHLTVAGIYSDRALLRGFTLPLSEFDQLFQQDRLQQVLVKLAPDASYADAYTGLKQALADLPGVVVRSKQQLEAEASNQTHGVLVLFYALFAMSVVMALLGTLNALTLSIHERTRELGVLRAVGMTRAQARTLIREESVITAAIGTLVGLVLGLLLAFIVTRALSAEGIVFVVPWPQLGMLLIAGMLVGVLASVPPAARAAKLDVLSAIAHE